MKLTEKDQDMLRDIEVACSQWDGYSPHGPAEGRKILRLERLGLVRYDGIGQCETCPDPHDAKGYVLTEAGKAARA